jgi:hypothetical protein
MYYLTSDQHVSQPQILIQFSDHELQPVPRHERLCRFCIAKAESPEHALLECQASPEVLNLRNVFLGKLLRAVPRIELLKALIYKRSTITLVGKFVDDVLEVFYRLPVYRPSRRGN